MSEQNVPEEQLRRDGIIPKRDPETPAQLINLSRFYTASLDDDWLVTAGANLQSFPRGMQRLAGVDFDIRGLIQLAGTSLYDESEMDEEAKKTYYPERIENIPVQLYCHDIHFLHAASWWAEAGETIGLYRIHYENGYTTDVPIQYLVTLRDWWTAQDDPLPKDADIAWKGQHDPAKKAGCHILVFKFTWHNPKPELRVASIDFISLFKSASPYLIAITVQQERVVR